MRMLTTSSPVILGPSVRLAALSLVLLTVANLPAASIAVNNASFESATYPGAQTWTNNLDDTDAGTFIEWRGRDGNNDGDAFIERIGGFISEGTAHIGMAQNYFVYENTGVAWQPNTRYTLIVGVGNRNATFTTATNLSLIGLSNTVPAAATTAALLAADPILAGANATRNAFPQGASVFQDLTMVFNTGAVAPAGSLVVIMGDNSGGGRSHFDNVRLDATPIPEPAVFALFGLVGAGMIRRRR